MAPPDYRWALLLTILATSSNIFIKGRLELTQVMIYIVLIPDHVKLMYAYCLSFCEMREMKTKNKMF